ncbi:crossover junction endonuclease MUS81 isoform X2 [Centruroides vittatus]|uniref:crossover junction endonuclease MUS81 isoform X2 n=1 Tax=Centruroides vittatus TaxID=120091 RepID=UPI00350F14A1
MEKGEVCVMKKRTKRKKIVYECPNPLFAKWLKEWRDEAIEKGWKIQHTYSRALKSLEKYPLPLKSPWEAKCYLNYFDTGESQVAETSEKESTSNSGTKRSRKDEDKGDNSHLPSNPKQKRMCTKTYIPVPGSGSYAILITLMKNEIDTNESFMKKQDLIDSAQLLCNSSFTRPEPGSHYTAWSSMGNLIRKGLVTKYGNPAKYSLSEGGRMLAVSLMESESSTERQDNNREEMVRDSSRAVNTDIRKETQGKKTETPRLKYKFIDINGKETDDYRKALQIKDDLSGFIGYLIKCNRKDLIQSGMRHKIDETRLMLGEDVYAYLHKSDCNQYGSTLGNVCINSLDVDQSCSNDYKNKETVLYPGTFDVVLIVDNCEVCVGSSNDHRIAVLKELAKMGVIHEVRKLYVGDFLWIARKRNSVKENYEEELVLDYLVERKRMDDLARSIKDGRFREQKFRIKETGIKHPIYLVEEYGTNQYFGLPDASLKQAIVNCQVVDGFLITKTKNAKSTVDYLTTMTRYLQCFYNEKELKCCNREEYINSVKDSNRFLTFKEFNSSAVKKKQLVLKEMFAKHLIQISGISPDKAYALVQMYPTPNRLIEAYQKTSEGERLLSEIIYGRNHRKIGPKISQIVFRLYGDLCPRFSWSASQIEENKRDNTPSSLGQ